MYWCGLQGLKQEAFRADLCRKMAGDSQCQQPLQQIHPPQGGTAEFISHIWGITGTVHVRKGRKYHTGRGEGNKKSETTEGISKAKEQKKFLHDRESISLQSLEENIV